MFTLAQNHAAQISSNAEGTLPTLMNERDQVIHVEVSLLRKRLDLFLKAQFPEVSRGTIQRLLDEGHILVNGQIAKPTHHPKAGETISIHWPEAKLAEAKPEEIPLKILFEDEHLLVIDKAPGIVVHPSAGHDEHTLVNALLHHCHGQLSGIGGVARPGIVHRLDKDTSGCLVVAKNDAAHLGLADQFAKRTLQKFYELLCCGVVPDEKGEINLSIGRHPVQRKKMAIIEGGKDREAITSFKVKERFATATRVEAQLHTGRTHQIRVHFQHLGFPIVGDATYGLRQNKKFREQTGIVAERQLLHAARLNFKHPVTAKWLKVAAPLPEDFEAVIEKLR
jgi:23S rRNA pseudouridine1911/1915/1917 synthase